MKTPLPAHVRRAIALGQGLPRETPAGRASERSRLADVDAAMLEDNGKVRQRGRSEGQAAYAQLLELRRRAGEIQGPIHEESIRLRLAERTWYWPDFLFQLASGEVQVHEYKGHWEDDARAKLKIAAELHPWARFFAVRRVQGSFVLEEIPGARFVGSRP